MDSVGECDKYAEMKVSLLAHQEALASFLADFAAGSSNSDIAYALRVLEDVRAKYSAPDICFDAARAALTAPR